MEGIQTFKGSWPWPWPLIRPYGIPSCITHRPLPIYQISLESKKLFVDGRTDVRTDIFPPLILLGRLLEVDLKMLVYIHTKFSWICVDKFRASKFLATIDIEVFEPERCLYRIPMGTTSVQALNTRGWEKLAVFVRSRRLSGKQYETGS